MGIKKIKGAGSKILEERYRRKCIDTGRCADPNSLASCGDL